MSSFSLRLKQLREERNLTQEELGKALGISRNTIASWEADRRTPELNKAEQIASFFQVSIDYLLGRSNTPNIDDSNELFSPDKLLPEERKLWERMDIHFRRKKPLTMGQIRAILAIMAMEEEDE